MQNMKQTLLSFGLSLSVVAGGAFSEEQTMASENHSSETIIEHPPEKDFDYSRLSPYQFSFEAIDLKQDLSSDLTATVIEEKSTQYALRVRRNFKMSNFKTSMSISLGDAQSVFNYADGQARLKCDGYIYGLYVSYQHNSLAKLVLKAGISQSKIKGRDFVDYLTGRTGLTVDPVLKETHYHLTSEYEILKLWKVPESKHSFHSHLGLEKREWNMSIGWTNNVEENMDIGQPWLAGLSYQWSKKLPQRDAGTFILKLRTDILDEGHRARLNLILDF